MRGCEANTDLGQRQQQQQEQARKEGDQNNDVTKTTSRSSPLSKQRSGAAAVQSTSTCFIGKAGQGAGQTGRQAGGRTEC